MKDEQPVAGARAHLTPEHQRQLDMDGVFVGVSRQALDETLAAHDDMLAALVEILGPLNVCSDNPHVDDHIVLPVDMTMGELRKARAAIAKARGSSQ